MKESSRFELRINTDLKRKFNKFCKDQNINLSEAVRQAITGYMSSKPFIYSLIEYLQDQRFYDSFVQFYITLPSELKLKLDELLGSEEETLVMKAPPQILKNVKVITNRGNKALEHCMGQNI